MINVSLFHWIGEDCYLMLKKEVIGLDKDFNLLQAKLLDQDLRYGVVSVVGMPGLGKTTLAKKLYRHVCDLFECFALVYVSQQPRLGEILLDIAKQVGLTEEERKDDLEANLRSLLKGKRYLGHMPHSIAKLKHLMTLDIQGTSLRIACDSMEMKQLRHLCLPHYRKSLFIKTSIFSSSTNPTLLPNLQTLIWADGDYMEAKWFHQWTNLRRLGLNANGKFMMELFSTPMAILPKLEVQANQLLFNDNLLKLRLMSDLKSVNFGALPANLIKLSLWSVVLDKNHIIAIKALPKLKILKLRDCDNKFGDYPIDLSGIGSFPQLELLHIVRSFPIGLRGIIMDEVGAPELNKFIVFGNNRHLIKLSERLKRLAVTVDKY